MSHHFTRSRVFPSALIFGLLPLRLAGQAVVVLTNNGTSVKRSVQAGVDGSYRFVNLVPGNYWLDIEQPGFRHYTRDQIAVEVDGRCELKLQCRSGMSARRSRISMVEGQPSLEQANLEFRVESPLRLQF